MGGNSSKKPSKLADLPTVLVPDITNVSSSRPIESVAGTMPVAGTVLYVQSFTSSNSAVMPPADLPQYSVPLKKNPSNKNSNIMIVDDEMYSTPNQDNSPNVLDKLYDKVDKLPTTGNPFLDESGKPLELNGLVKSNYVNIIAEPSYENIPAKNSFQPLLEAYATVDKPGDNSLMALAKVCIYIFFSY